MRVVVVGSGALGSSTAYHLRRKGAEVVLVDQFALASQTSPRAAGLTTKAASTDVMTRLMDEAVDALASFKDELGRDVDYHQSGSMKAAYSEAGEQRVRADAARANSLGITVHTITPAEAHALAPHYHPGEPRVVIHTPSDGWVDPATIAIGFAERAGELGAELRPFTRVTGLLKEGDAVVGVRTESGTVQADAVVDAAGGWARGVAAAAGFPMALVPVRHQLLITEPIPGVEPLQPIVRLLEASVYVRYAHGGLMLGGYEDAPMLFDPIDRGPEFAMDQLPLDLGVLRGLAREVAAHFPVLMDAPVAIHRGGTPSMTPDGLPVVGAVPGAERFFVISGCCVGGLSVSPAAGRALADLVLQGRSEPDLGRLSPARFGPEYADRGRLESESIYRYARKYTK
ncbi:MAG: FAD-binding oxidoreductase [Chloroflexota bacterium]